MACALAVIPACPASSGDKATGSDAGEPFQNTATRAQAQQDRERRPAIGPNSGRWTEGRAGATDAGLTDEQRDEIQALEELGYADGIHAGGKLSGVTRHVPELAGRGMLLFTSAHAPTTMLIDRQGRVLHSWFHEYSLAFPGRPDTPKSATFWRRTHLYDNGDLLAVYEGAGIIRIDKDSRLVWRSPVRAHHDFAVLEDGSVWVLTREAAIVPRVHAERPVLVDYISLLDVNGREQRRISFLEALEGSDYLHFWDGGPGIAGDLFHVNSLRRLDGSIAQLNPAFREGNLLLSSRHLDILAVLDPDQERIVWAMKGAFNAQHDVQVLENGNLLLFDNNPVGKVSRVVELDPATGAERWVYQGSEAEPFYSETCGLAQRLPGGNTLITESDFGRAFEVTADGDIVWEYYNPHRAGDQDQYIATIMEMKRLAPDVPLDWLDP